MAEDAWTLERVRAVEAEMREHSGGDIENLNNMLVGVRRVEKENVKVRIALIYCLRRAISNFPNQNIESFKAAEAAFTDVLESCALEVDMDVAKAALLASLTLAATGQTSRTPAPLIESLLDAAPASETLLETLETRFLTRFIDVRLWMLDALTKRCQRSVQSNEPIDGPVIRLMFRLLLKSNSPLQQEDAGLTLADEMIAQTMKRQKRKRVAGDADSAPRSMLKAHRQALAECWLVFVALDLPDDVLDQALTVVSSEVLSTVAHPLRFADFLTESYNRSSLSALLALDGLFTLISDHKLDYPLFFTKLYSLIRAEIFLHQQRKRFLTLVPKFLLGKYMPEYLAAAFLKRLTRVALQAPPHGAMWCLRLALDLMRRNPSTYILVHRPQGHQSSSLNFFTKTQSTKKGFKANSGELGDPYRSDEVDPRKSNAISSSLWELEAIRRHYCPAVARMAEPFSRDVRRQGTTTPAAPPPGDVSDYVGMDYSDLYEAEFKRRYTEIPLEYSVLKPDFSVQAIIDWS